MLVNSRFNIWKAIQTTGAKFLFFVAWSSGISGLSKWYGIPETFLPTPMLMVLGSGVGVFLAFRINSGYDRWWEARKIWGELQGVSRSFALSVTAFLVNENPSVGEQSDKASQKELIYLHLGFVNSLRLYLRNSDSRTWENELWSRNINGTPLVPESEAEKIKNTRNIPCQIVQLQGQKITRFFQSDLDDLRYFQLFRLVYQFNDILGSCERIKNTTFPWGYAFYTRHLVWLMAALLPFGFVQELDIAGIILCALISTTFVTIEQVGRNLDNPFENAFNDTPMSSLSRLIEIDLLEQLGEESPAPLQAQNGVLK